MITKIELQIVPGESIPESLLRSFMAEAEKEGISPEEFIARLMAEAVNRSEEKEAA